MTTKNFDTLLENQKIIADTISVSLSKKELELLIDKLSEMSITNKQAIDIYQKLTKKLVQYSRIWNKRKSYSE